MSSLLSTKDMVLLIITLVLYAVALVIKPKRKKQDEVIMIVEISKSKK